MSSLLASFEGQIRDIVSDCIAISHYYKGIDYNAMFEISPFEKQLMVEFIEKDQEREMKIRSASFGGK